MHPSIFQLLILGVINGTSWCLSQAGLAMRLGISCTGCRPTRHSLMQFGDGHLHNCITWGECAKSKHKQGTGGIWTCNPAVGEVSSAPHNSSMLSIPYIKQCIKVLCCFALLETGGEYCCVVLVLVQWSTLSSVSHLAVWQINFSFKLEW